MSLPLIADGDGHVGDLRDEWVANEPRDPDAGLPRRVDRNERFVPVVVNVGEVRDLGLGQRRLRPEEPHPPRSLTETSEALAQASCVRRPDRPDEHRLEVVHRRRKRSRSDQAVCLRLPVQRSAPFDADRCQHVRAVHHETANGSGGMFWLRRNRFVGSYSFFTATSRASVSGGYDARTLSGSASAAKLTYIDPSPYAHREVPAAPARFTCCTQPRAR